jgi:hypothetical protein
MEISDDPGDAVTQGATRSAFVTDRNDGFFSNPHYEEAIPVFFRWTRSRKPLYRFNNADIHHAAAVAWLSDDFGDSD